MKKFFRKLINRKYKKEGLIKSLEEEKFRDLTECIDIRRGQGCGLGR
jgi:hypothetical protein